MSTEGIGCVATSVRDEKSHSRRERRVQAEFEFGHSTLMLDLLSSSQVLDKAGEQSRAAHTRILHTFVCFCFIFLARASYTEAESRLVQK